MSGERSAGLILSSEIPKSRSDSSRGIRYGVRFSHSLLCDYFMADGCWSASGAGHVLYPAAIALARFLELHADRLLHGSDGKGKGKGKGKAVLELGAGGGLPGLVAALEGAGNVS
jgi:hypothetical protein